jgi:hypothetical protein
MAAIKYAHLYNGPDGLAHFRDEEIDLSDGGHGVLSSAILSANGMLFRCNTSSYSLDWHPAPRKAFSINLKGAVEVTASDGEVRVFGPGDIMLADDMGGKGHLSRAAGTEDRVCLFVNVPD